MKGLSMVNLFTSETCPKCKIIKEWLNNNDIEYEECNISTDYKAKAILLSYGVMSVPSALINDHMVIGLDRIKDLLSYLERTKDVLSYSD